MQGLTSWKMDLFANNKENKNEKDVKRGDCCDNWCIVGTV